MKKLENLLERETIKLQKEKEKTVEKIYNVNNNIEKRDKDNNVEIITVTSLENSKESY